MRCRTLEASNNNYQTRYRCCFSTLPEIKNKNSEGMRVFIDYTNEWKGRVEEAKKHIEGEQAISFDEVKVKASKLSLSFDYKNGS